MSTKISEIQNYLAKLIAANVRNAMENFHCKYLSDAQMKELNPIIRNSIYTALVKSDEQTEAMNRYYDLYVPEDCGDCVLLSGADTKIRQPQNYHAKLIAAVVINQMADFRSKYLSDAQMEELSPIIRNGIYTALVNINEQPTYMAFYELYVPPYWEDCKLLKI